MKDKIVFWGTDEKDKDILVVLRLRAADNRVDIWTFPKGELEESFVEKMFQDWDNIKVEEFPATSTHIEQSMSEQSLLPENIKANNTEIINRAEKEWYVKVLSSKLSAKLQEEVEQLAEQVKTLTNYEQDIWEMARSYWDRVNNHFQARDLSREQTGHLRDIINEAFSKLKSLRKTSTAKIEEQAKANAGIVMKKIDTIFKHLEGNPRLNEVFDHLKGIQQEVREMRLPRKLESEIRDKLNTAFQIVRDQRRNLQSNRMLSRIRGLQNAIGKMEYSMNQDKDDLEFQQKRIGSSRTGQLEMQLREAKIQMINARIVSKEVKLEDMYKTLDSLKMKLEQEEKRAEEEKKRYEARKAKEAAKGGKLELKKKVKILSKTQKTKPVVETPKVVTPEVPKVEAVVETPKIGAPEVPKVEAVVETPKVVTPEVPKVEAVVETPKIGAPEVPKVEAVVETPKVVAPEVPKVEAVVETADHSSTENLETTTQDMIAELTKAANDNTDNK